MRERRLNIVVLVVDSLRAQSLDQADAQRPRTPFLDNLSGASVAFQRAYATECWTLPAHLSMFTGLLPSEHGAHFQTMTYARRTPPIAEILAASGYHTELVTRNFVFDGTILGVTRGFQAESRPLAPLSRASLIGLFLAFAKPRVRRHIRTTGFFHPRHSDQRAFVRSFARSLMPADDLALGHVLEVMARCRRAQRPYFVFCNLYDVHAPYPPAARSLLEPWDSVRHAAENLAFPAHFAKLGQHAYLRSGFSLSPWGREVLRNRYHRAIALMDDKLAAFHAAARADSLLDDTLLIVTSDHGEAFGEHGLYLHDASVYDTHLHVPLWIQSPSLTPAAVEDVVSTKELFGVMLAAAGQLPTTGTILNAAHRAAHPYAVAEHFFYPHRADMAARYRQNLLAVIIGDQKFVVTCDGVDRYDRIRDRDELRPAAATIEDMIRAVRGSGAVARAIDATVTHVREWANSHRTLGVRRVDQVALPAVA